MAQHRLMYHLHIGLNTWADTKTALRQIFKAAADHGHVVDRFGLCLDRGMSVPEANRATTPKETGPRLQRDEWQEVAQTVPIQPHLGDFMLGTPAALENSGRALEAGITTIGNLGQYFAFDLPAGYDDESVTEVTVQALGMMATWRSRGALVHSYLDDGPAVQFSHYGYYIGWAALELHIAERLVRAKVAHSFGGLVPDPEVRMILALALHYLHERKSVGSMVYGNTVGYGDDAAANRDVLKDYLLADMAVQLHEPTGHAINPVPLTEGSRIPSADEILDVQLFARSLEADAERVRARTRWSRLESRAAELTRFGHEFATRVLGLLEGSGVDVTDAAALLLELRRSDPAELERKCQPRSAAPPAKLEQWKTAKVKRYAELLQASGARLSGVRVLLAVLDVHDTVRLAIARALPELGAEVILLPTNSSAAMIARAAIAEDVDAVIVGTYNGAALTLGREIHAALGAERFSGALVFGGVLNQDAGEGLPRDARPELASLGIHCVDRLEELAPLLASTASRPGAVH